MTWSNHNIKAKDVQIVTNKKKIQFILRSSKTNGKNVRLQKVKIQSLSLKHDTKKEISRSFCPYRLLQKCISLRGTYHNQNEPFFVFADGTGVSAAQMRDRLKQMLKAVGFDHWKFETHSF